ncbi:integrase [Kitasatospora sp. NPDC059795]|uniref:integrase n=1 Tax=Kitasatospora sp. NPDC059795 TaxID=3346949 RepID=UPI0036643AE1
MTTAVEDPYRLCLPSPVTPVLPAARIRSGSSARYADGVWPLAPLSANPSAKTDAIHWAPCPEPLREQFRLAAWTMLNGELRPTFLRAHRGLRSRLSAQGYHQTVVYWLQFARWLHRHDVTTLSACDDQLLHAYGIQVRDSGLSRNSVGCVLAALTRLWAFDQLSALPTGIARPPWEEHGADGYLPPAVGTSGGENLTEALAAETMGPLLVWAIRVVDDFADDILAAWAANRAVRAAARTNRATTAARDTLYHHLDHLLETGTPLPSVPLRHGHGLARQYLAALTGASDDQVTHYRRLRRLEDPARWTPGPAPLDTPITGTVHQRPWREAIDFTESVHLVRHLGTACFIVIAYLTGMRPGEVLGLRTGCCPEPATGDRHLIRGRAFKSAVDDDGNHLSEGVERAVPWVAIAPVVRAVRAVRVLERLTPDDNRLLFGHNTHDARSPRLRCGSISPETVRARIEDFIAWANREAARHHLPHETIPPDPHGAIGTARFRRTLAWHIARRPGGTVALAVQCGHLRTTLAAGYASRSRDGIHTLLDIETVRACADTALDLHQHLADGGGLSGPAARRALAAAARAPDFAGTAINATTAHRYLARDDLLVHDNPNTLLMCVYKHEQALCHRAATAPALDHCVPVCGNIARTDHHAHRLRERAHTLLQQAAHLPGPLADRLTATTGRLTVLAEHHDAERRTLPEAP